MLDYTPLSDKQRQQFNDEGYLIIRNVLSDDTLDRLIAAGDRIIETDNIRKRQRKANGLFDSVRNCIELDDVFLPLLTQEKTLPLVIQLFGPNLRLTTTHLIYRVPNSKDTPPTLRLPHWHRDIAHSFDDLGHANVPRMQIKCAYYLTDCTEPNSGATLILPGSNHWKEPLSIPEGEADPIGVLEPSLAAGDCLLFENRTWHAGGSNFTNRTRKAVMFGYGYRWLKPVDYLRQPPDLVDTLDLIGRFLVGEPLSPGKKFYLGGGRNPLRKWCAQHGVSYKPPD